MAQINSSISDTKMQSHNFDIESNWKIQPKAVVYATTAVDNTPSEKNTSVDRRSNCDIQSLDADALGSNHLNDSMFRRYKKKSLIGSRSDSPTWIRQPKGSDMSPIKNEMESSVVYTRGPPRALEEQYYTRSSKNTKMDETSNVQMNYKLPRDMSDPSQNTKSFQVESSGNSQVRDIADHEIQSNNLFTATNKTPGDVKHRSKGCIHNGSSCRRMYRQQTEDPTQMYLPKHKISREQYNQVIKTTVQNLDLECVCPRRAGVIIYTVVGESIYFGLGLDSRTHDLTDFGGGVCYRKDHNVVNGALREFDEETLSIFEPITFDKIKHCPTIYDNNNLIIFIHMNIEPDIVSRKFNEQYTRIIEMRKCGSPRRHRDPEVCGITWLTWEEFRYCIKENGIMFNRVQKFLAKADDFSYLL